MYEQVKNDNTGWNVWCQRPTRSQQKTYYRLDVTADSCPESVPVSVTSRGDNIVVTGVGATVPIPDNNGVRVREQPLEVPDLQGQLESVDPSLQWVIEDLELPEDGGLSIAEAIKAGKGRCISDGSLKELFGTSAFKFIMGTDPTYVGRNRVPGTDRDQTSYRSELCGMLGNVIMVNAIIMEFGYGGVKIAIKCDGAPELKAIRREVGLLREMPTVPIDVPVNVSKSNGAVERTVRSWQGRFK